MVFMVFMASGTARGRVHTTTATCDVEVEGGSVAEWSACWTRNPAVLDFGSPSATLVNSELVCLRPIGILNNVMSNLKCFASVVCSAPLSLLRSRY